VSTPSNKGGRPWFERPLVSFFESVGVLVGDDVTIALAGLHGQAALNPCRGDVFWVETCLLGSEQGRVAVVVDEALVRSLGAKLLMLPASPDEVTDEIELAFDEIINVAIGAWNREVHEENRRWNNGVDARSLRRIPVAEALSDEPPERVRAVGFSLTLDGETHALALVGTGDWLPGEASLAAPGQAGAAPPLRPEVASGRSSAAPSSQPTEGSPPPPPLGSVTPIRAISPSHDESIGQPGSRPVSAIRPRPNSGAATAAAVVPASPPELDQSLAASAAIAVVDVTGAFLQWFYEQLRNPDFVFSHCPESFLDTGEYRAVLLVHPRALQDAGMAFEQKIIMRPS
jgi:hypothetical protein